MQPTPKEWIFTEVDEHKVEALNRSLNVNPSLCQILVARGIEDFQTARNFFNPAIEDLHDPFLMMNMEEAIEIIQSAISENKKILLYGDYDVDGTMAVSLMYNFFSKRYQNLEYYIPDRHQEGYGVSEKAIFWAEAKKIDLIITLDCGIKAIRNIQLAKSKGIDTIVVDHHTPAEELPPALTILNPKLPQNKYPFRDLSAAGVAFKLISAWSIMESGTIEYALPYLDLAAISTSADVVPLCDENRTILSLGLREINKRLNPNLNYILNLAGSTEQIDNYTLGYVIGPRINAIGRLGDANRVVDVFTALDVSDVEEKLKEFNTANDERKRIDSDITNSALEILSSDPQFQARKSTTLCDPSWHKGVVGIVASRVMEYYYRPTVICTENNGEISCSARSVKDYNILEALDQCSELFSRYGGHFYAAGISMPSAHWEQFQKKFEEVVSSSISDDQLVPKVHIDAEIKVRDVNLNYYNTISRMAPFGEKNPVPQFLIRDVYVIPGSTRLLKNEHLSFVVKSGSQKMKVIGFRKAALKSIVESHDRLDLVFKMLKNEYRGNTTIELQLEDLRVCSN